MAKQCLYCGQPLTSEDARVCNQCGRAQISPSASTTGPAPIKVKLPPKEFSSADAPSVQQESSWRSQVLGAARPPQRAQPIPQPSRLPKHPIRLNSQESAAINDAPEKMGISPDSQGLSAGSARAETVQSASAEEASTMVTPGWREELEQLRKEQQARATSNGPVIPTKPSDEPVQATPSPPKRPQRATVGPQNAPQKNFLSEPLPDINAPEASNRLAAQPRPELRVNVWEQEPTVQFSHTRVEKEQAGPAPAIERAPFANLAFGQEEQMEQIADKETVHWQIPSSDPTPSHESHQIPLGTSSGPISWQSPGPVLSHESYQPASKMDASRMMEEEKEKQISNEVEDQPTDHLAVLEDAQRQPSLTIERTSTPAPTTWTSAQAEKVDEQPTRPMPASPAAPRSPIPPAAPLMSQSREQHEFRPTNQAISSNPASLPGISSPISAGQPLNATQAPGAAFGMPAAHGHAVNPQSQLGQTFDPASLPPLPLPQGPGSLPGNTAFRSEMQSLQQHPPAAAPDIFAQRSPSFASPNTPWPTAFATPPNTPRPGAPTPVQPAKARRRKRMSGRTVALLVLFLLVVGASSFLVFYQSTSGGAIIQPYQSFQNNTLGVAFNYPQGWKVTVDQAHNSAHFADNDQTGQITFSMAAANGQQLNQYLSQETAQLGITALQTAPTLTFAGASWQQVQGDVTQKGATWTTALYVTEQNNRFYVLAFQAPATAYKQMEQDNFAPLRHSFRFL